MSEEFRGQVDIGRTITPGTIADPALGMPVLIRLDGDTADISAGGNGRDGDIVLRASTNQNRVRLDGQGGNAWLGGNGADGDIVLFRTDGDNATLAQSTIHLDGQQANVWLGGNGADGDVVLFPTGATNNHDLSQATIHLDGQSGDITLNNADFAEDFDISEFEEMIEPGTVMVLDPEGKLRQSTEAYDKKVAGVLSGAGDCRPGIILDKKHSQNKRLPVALNGKVYCKVQAHNSPIEIGDLLTTSEAPGHAMKAGDSLRAFGAVIGKALRPLPEGEGMIPILVALQ